MHIKIRGPKTVRFALVLLIAWVGLAQSNCAYVPWVGSDDGEVPEMQGSPEEEEGKETSSSVPRITAPKNPQEMDSQKGTPPPILAEGCLKKTHTTQKLPVWLKDAGIVVTHILQECQNTEGHSGYRKDSNWMALGFPCTGGNGKVDIGGHYAAPNIVSLILSTDCAMAPASLNLAQQTGSKALVLDKSAKLLAYNPLAIQFWELPGFVDADVGFSVDLRSPDAKSRAWKLLSEKRQPLSVSLYGRENAWTHGQHFYHVEGEIILTGTHTFRLLIKSVKALETAEMEQVKKRCESLRPRRNCHLVFN